MADAKITALTQLTGAPDPADLAVIVDDVAGTPTSKKITLGDLFTLLAVADPAATAANQLRIYAKNISGRILPKWIGPAGLDTVFQPALFGNNSVLFAPSSGTTGTGTGWGTVWTPGGTVSHPTPVTTSPAIIQQMRRTMYTNVVTTTNQTLGIISTAAGLPQFWMGNAAGLGGFFFFCRFDIELWPAATVRLFVGLTSLATAMVASDAPTGDFCGLWHDTTDSATTLSLITRNNVTTTKTAITGVPTIASKQGFDFYMFVPPNSTTLYYRLVNINTGAEIVNTSLTTTLPRNTIFMGPQIQMSNGTANVTVTTTAIAINRVYIESDN
jgi:hypothetical protein